MPQKESTENGSKWKDAFLKTGLPLELLVAEHLADVGFFIRGEYPYLRKSEQGADKEFSVDLWASFDLGGIYPYNWGVLHFLIECKYNYPGVKWIFAPNPGLTSPGYVRIYDFLCHTRLTDLLKHYQLELGQATCINGVELHSTNSYSQSIKEALSQVRFAIPSFLKGLWFDQAVSQKDEDLKIHLFCPMIVTTASLWVLQKGLTLQNYKDSSKIEEFAEEVSDLLIYQQPGPQLRNHIQGHLNLFPNDHRFPDQVLASIKEKHNQANGVLSLTGNAELAISPNYLRMIMENATEKMLVGTVDTLRERTMKLIEIALSIESCLTKYATHDTTGPGYKLMSIGQT